MNWQQGDPPKPGFYLLRLEDEHGKFGYGLFLRDSQGGLIEYEPMVQGNTTIVAHVEVVATAQQRLSELKKLCDSIELYSILIEEILHVDVIPFIRGRALGDCVRVQIEDGRFLICFGNTRPVSIANPTVALAAIINKLHNCGRLDP